MKSNQFILTLLFSLSFSLIFAQNNSDAETYFNYKAQTRGFLHQLKLTKKQLSITNLEETKIHILTKKETKTIDKLFEKINVNSLKSETDIKNLALDKVIKVNIEIICSNKNHHFEFIRWQLPPQLQEFVNYLNQLK
ncbi:MAG: hypothetical protein ACWA42_07995 [Lutibacter sp.]